MIWGTREEIEYLKDLGGHCSKMGNARLATRRQLLMSYRQAMERRKDWGKIDREVIAAYLSMELGGGISP